MSIAHANSNTYSHGHANINTYHHGHTNRHSYTDSDGYIYAKAYADSKGLTSAEATPDSGTAPVSGYHHGGDSALRCPNAAARVPTSGLPQA